MRKLIALCALFLCAWAEDDDVQQSVKSFKGGHNGQFLYNPGANFANLFGNRTQYGFVTVNHTQGNALASENLHGQNQGQSNQGFVHQQGQAFDTENLQGQAYGAHHQEGQSYGSNFQQGQTYGSQHHQGQEYGTNYQQGQAYGSNGQQGQAYGSNGQQGQAYGSSGQQGQVYGSNGQQGQAYGINSQQGQAYGSNGIQGQTYSNYGHQGQNVGGNNLQGQSFGSQFQQGHGPQHGINMRPNLTSPIDYNIGVCYVEVPTASLARDSKHIPAGNGSRPDLSTIRTCCKGYIRNIHNFKICDPVCTVECVNALCTAPDTCTCFPDHVKNTAGFCVATCPIGCQNGRCNGRECECKDGYKLDINGKFCVPICKENCAGIGNCTEPNTCQCKPGYQSSPEGSCKPSCDSCLNGDCVSPNECRCHQGYVKEQGKCIPQCASGCPGGRCVSPNNCNYPPVPSPHQNNPVPLESANQHLNPYQNQSGYPHQNQPSYPYPNQGNSHPPCSQTCVNGQCLDGKCICNQGYVTENNDFSGARCVPSCPGGCPNGICSSPNFCICNVGYVKDHNVKGRPTCTRRAKRSLVQQEMEKKPLNVAELIRYEIPEDVSYSVNLLE